MSVENDYVLRLVQQLVQFIAKLLLKKTPEAVAEAEAKLDATARDALGFDLAQLARFDEASLKRLLAQPQSLALYGELLALRVQLADHPEQAKALRARARRMLELAIAAGSYEPSRLAERIAELS